MDVVAALDLMCTEDPDLALDAEGAFDALTAGEGVEQITQIGLQEFLWYRLPEKFLTDDAHKRRVAQALGRLLDLVELPRYAAICASEQTATVLAAYEDDNHALGRQAFRSAMHSSGIEPVDVEELAWGTVMGVEEVGAYFTVAVGLEFAITAGEFTPGGRGWKQRQCAVVRQQLLRARAELDGECLLDRVTRERITRWLGAHGTRRQEIVEGVRERLQGPAALPDDVDRHVAPVPWLLEQAAGGLPLTQTHRLKPATVLAVAQEFGWLATGLQRCGECLELSQGGGRSSTIPRAMTSGAGRLSKSSNDSSRRRSAWTCYGAAGRPSRKPSWVSPLPRGNQVAPVSEP